jgi:hypothetical protein
MSVINKSKRLIKTTISKQQVIDRVDELKSSLSKLFEKLNAEFHIEDTYEFNIRPTKRKGDCSVLEFKYGDVWGFIFVDPRVIVSHVDETTLFEWGAISFNFDNRPIEDVSSGNPFKYFGSPYEETENGFRGREENVLWGIGNYIYNSKYNSRKNKFLQEWCG